MANFDDIHMKLARKLFDPVATSATNGVKVTALLRTDYLNRANSFIQTTLLASIKNGDYSVIGQWLAGLVKVQTPTWASGGTTVATDYVHWISCVHSGTRLLWRDPSRKLELDNAFNPSDKNCFTIFGGKIYAYYNAAQLTTGTGSLYYLFNDTGATGAAILLDPVWHETLIDLAASFYFSDKGDLPFVQANTQRAAMVMSVLGK
jgi:hypothetical protein